MAARMRAVSQQSFGGPEVLAVVEVDRPEPAPAEVLVKVRAAGVNPVDWKTREGGGIAWMLGSAPLILGWDVSGVVEELGFGTSHLKVGDEVLGMPRFPHRANAYAEYVTAPSRHFVRKPATLSHEEAAALPLAGLTAYQILFDVADLQPGQRVLVQAAAGGVGHLAVQLAKAHGAYVIGTASEAKHDFLRSLGADEVIDYRQVDVNRAVSDVDLVLHLAGEPAVGTLRADGLIVSVEGGVSAELAEEAEKRGVRASGLLVEPDHAQLKAMVELIEASKLRVVVEQAFPLAEAAKAHELGAAGRVTGKLVLTV